MSDYDICCFILAYNIRPNVRITLETYLRIRMVWSVCWNRNWFHICFSESARPICKL